MRGARIFLVFSALIWLPYGIYCFFVPSALAESAGVITTSSTGLTELRAMYGGLQVAIGALAIAGLVRASVAPSALLAIGFLCAGLFSARILGVLMDGDMGVYTGGALLFEVLGLALAFTLYPASRQAAQAA